MPCEGGNGYGGVLVIWVPKRKAQDVAGIYRGRWVKTHPTQCRQGHTSRDYFRDRRNSEQGFWVRFDVRFRADGKARIVIALLHRNAAERKRPSQ